MNESGRSLFEPIHDDLANVDVDCRACRMGVCSAAFLENFCLNKSQRDPADASLRPNLALSS